MACTTILVGKNVTSSCRRFACADPCGYEHSYAYAGHERADPCDDASKWSKYPRADFTNRLLNLCKRFVYKCDKHMKSEPPRRPATLFVVSEAGLEPARDAADDGKRDMRAIRARRAETDPGHDRAQRGDAGGRDADGLRRRPRAHDDGKTRHC